ncbi:MAG: hypothetical protein Rhirs2KO_18620 [Rhizobiaceae bacterium]
MISWAFAGRLLGGLGKVLMMGVTIPVGLILAVSIWAYFDRSSAIRQAVDEAVTELVDGAELEAAEARLEALQKILAEKERINQRDQESIARFGQMLAEAAIQNEGLIDEIADLEAQPLDVCVVDDALLERLR